MENVVASLDSLVRELPPITLEEMAEIRLMNRTDTKFVTSIPVLFKLLEMAKGAYYSQETCGHRLSPYATTYWDGAAHREMFTRHECGRLVRTKVRVRTYVDSGLSFLEVKQKDNHGKTEKRRVAVSSPQAVEQLSEGEEFLESTTGYRFSDIVPTLSNSFLRITLVNFDKTERLTIDTSLRFQNIVTGCEACMDNVAVIELKRDGRAHSPIIDLLRLLRVKPAGFSKYCMGMALTDSSLRTNRLKPKFRKIGKLTSGVPLTV